MSKGICLWSSVALRADASHSSEMVSQLLFGETYSVLETATEWTKICTLDCQYEGWISSKQHTPLSDEEFEAYAVNDKIVVHDLITRIYNTTDYAAFPIFIGSQFPTPDANGNFVLAGLEYAVENRDILVPLNTTNPADKQDALLHCAFQLLNSPYLWGGRTPAGIDCSGFVQVLFKNIGIAIPRDASQQVELGENVDFVDEARVGDLAFFENEEGRVVHVGMVCGERQIIHASGHVQVNVLDDTGIFNQYTKKYTHKLRIIKRIL